MKYSLTAKTGIAEFLLFDPVALPEEIDSQSDKSEFLMELRDDLPFLHTFAGSRKYKAHLYVDQEIPDHLRQYVKHTDQPEVVEGFQVTSGTVCFTGAEYAYHADDSRLKASVDGGECVSLPCGRYRLTSWWLYYGYPDGMFMDEYRQRTSRLERVVHELAYGIWLLAILACLTLFVSLCFTTWSQWLMVVLPAVVFTIVATIVIGRSGPNQRAAAVESELFEKYPGFVAKLELIP